MEFSCLDTTINLQTWVVLLDFLGMGAKVHDNPQDTAAHTGDGDRAQATQDTEATGGWLFFFPLACTQQTWSRMDANCS